MKFSNKKGLYALIAAGAGLGGFAIVLATVALILVQFQTQMTVNGTAYNITQQGLQGLLSMANFIGIIAIALVGVYLMGLVIRQFVGFGGGSASGL